MRGSLLLLACALHAGEAPTLAQVAAGLPGLSLAPTVAAQIPTQPATGDWWPTVLALCRQHRLVPDAGLAARTRGAGHPVGTGPVILAAGTLPPSAIAGPLLISARPVVVQRSGSPRSLSTTFLARAQPSVAFEDIADLAIDDVNVVLEGGRRLTARLQRDDASSLATWRCDDVPAGIGRVRIEALVAITPAEPWSLGGATTPGQTFTAGAGTERIALAVFTATVPGQWEGETLPDQGPLVAVVAPARVATQDGLQPRLTADGTPLDLRQASMTPSADGQRILRIWRPRGALAGDLRLELAGRRPGNVSRQRISIPCDLATSLSSNASLAPDLSWPAGETTLQSAIDRLAAGGQRVMLELALDGGQRATLSAHSGGFWPGMLAICQAFRVSPAAPIASERWYEGGALRLTAGELPPAAAAGPVLVLADQPISEERRSWDASSRVIELRLRALIEPRLDPDDCTGISLAWASAATDERGLAHTLEASQPSEPTVIQRRRRRDTAPVRPTMRIHLVPGSTPQRLAVAGLLTLGMGRRITGTAQLALGDTVATAAGDQPVQLTAVAPGASLPGGIQGPGLLLVHPEDGVSPMLRVQRPDGEPLELTQATELDEQRSWFAGPLPQGRMQVDILLRLNQPDLVLPVRLEIPVE